MTRRSKSSGISAAAWFYSQSFHASTPVAPVADSRVCPDCRKPWNGVADRWDATANRWRRIAACCGAERKGDGVLFVSAAEIGK